MLATLAPSASVMKAISDAFSAFEEGMKWRPCACSEAGLLGSPDPAKKRGSCPGPKMNRSEIRSRSACAFDGTGTAMDAMQANESSLMVLSSLLPLLRICGTGGVA
jgi:hypothetical protein